MKLAIIIPTYNEAQNIPILIRRIRAVGIPATIIVVDDGSPDGTASRVRELQTNDRDIILKERPAKLGLASAYLDTIGEIASGYDVFLTMDADLSHDPVYITAMLSEIKSNDVVIGSRYVRGGGIRNWPFRRKFLSFFGNLYVRTVLGVSVHDMTSGFMMIRRDFLMRAQLEKIRASGYAFLFEMKFYFIMLGARVTEVPIIFTDRVNGDSKISSHILREGILMPFRIARNRPFYTEHP